MKPTTLNGLEADERVPDGVAVVIRDQRVAVVLGVVTAFAGCVILAGWVLELPALKALFPGQVEAKANTAFCFIMLGVALALRATCRLSSHPGGALGLLAGFFSAFAAVIGLLTLLQYGTGRNFGLDQMLVVEPAGATDTIHPGRMALPTALTFLLLGLALLMLDRWRDHPWLPALVLPTSVIAGLAFFGHLYDLPWLASLGLFTPIAAPTGLVSLILGLGILHAGSSRFLARLRRGASAIGFATALLLLAIMGGAVAHNTRSLVEANAWVEHTQRIIGRLGEVLSAMQDVEIGMRGYMLTADPVFLEPYHPAAGRVRHLMREMRELTEDNTAQVGRVRRLQAIVEGRLGHVALSIGQIEKDGVAGATAGEIAEQSKRSLGDVRATVEEMMREERRLLTERRGRIQLSTRKTMVTLGLGTALSIGLLFWVFRLLKAEIARRVGMTAALRRSEENLAVTLNSIGDAVLATDTAGRITRMNRVAEHLTGWPADEARGRPIGEIFRIINEATRAPGRIPVDDVLATGEIQGLANHTALIARDGSERPIADSAAPIRDVAGRVLGVVLVFRDVTAEYAARKALEESERRYRTLFESIEQGFCIVEMIFDDGGRPVDYRFMEINPAFEKQSGLKDVVGRRMREFAPDLESQWFETLGRVAETGEPIRFQNRAESLNRAYDIYAFRFGEGRNRQVAVLFSDVTERHQAEEELSRFFTLSLDFLCIASADGTFKRASPGITDILGWSVEEFLARPYLEQVHPDDRAATLRTVERQMVQGDKVFRFENRYQHKDGSWRTLSWRSAPHSGLMYATARDVTEARSKEREIQRLNRDLAQRATQLEAANKELEAFSYSVSHDLRAPLRHVQGYVEMLTRETGEGLSAKAQRYLKTIADAAREMGELIDDLLAFSRMGRTEMSETEVELNPLIDEVRSGMELAVNGRVIRWNVSKLPPVRGDAAMLRQVLANLLSNAVKYTRQRNPAEIEIGCERQDADEVVLYVRDNGAGFDMKYADKLFGVFQRLHRADEFEGTGIGLASVRRIITRHGGRIWAEGAVNTGATFRFILPAASPGDPPSPPSP